MVEKVDSDPSFASFGESVRQISVITAADKICRFAGLLIQGKGNMALNSKFLVMLVAMSILMAGCAGNHSKIAQPAMQTASASKQAAPEILAFMTSHGRGTPWGRSDSSDAFTRLTQTAVTATYGFTQGNPIKVGGLSESQEAGYLNGLRGPAGEPVDYERIGSCCPFKTDKALIDGVGLLDAFRVTYKGQPQAVTLYIDFYDEESLYVPLGFTPRGNGGQSAL
jgi:hypothetical protein